MLMWRWVDGFGCDQHWRRSSFSCLSRRTSGDENRCRIRELPWPRPWGRLDEGKGVRRASKRRGSSLLVPRQAAQSRPVASLPLINWRRRCMGGVEAQRSENILPSSPYYHGNRMYTIWVDAGISHAKSHAKYPC